MTEGSGNEPQDGHGIASEVVSMHQLIAWNMGFYRRASPMTQAELGAKLGWSFRAVSAAERTAARTDGKGRLFDAATLCALAFALDVPLTALFLPIPEDEQKPLLYQVGNTTLDASELLSMLVMTDNDDATFVMEEYRRRFSDAAYRWLDPFWAETVARWLRDRVAPDVRADVAARLRDRRDDLLQAAAEFGQLADAIDEPGGEDKEGS